MIRLGAATRLLITSAILISSSAITCSARHSSSHHKAAHHVTASADPDLATESITMETAAPSRGGSYRAVDLARQFYGCPYVHGGTSSRGFDCSGFTRYIYSRLGRSIPRTPQDQYHIGKPVSVANLQSGDLLFFHTYRPGVSHVGIYIGGGKFIHAESPRHGVTITDLSSTYYRTRFVGARRVM